MVVLREVHECFLPNSFQFIPPFDAIQNVLGDVNILGGHSIGHSEQESTCIYVHVPYSEWFPR
jgi:hypothetical protein